MSDELDDAFLALTLSDCPGAVAMDTDACEPYDPGPEPPAEEVEFSWMLATQFRNLRRGGELSLSMRAIASSSVHSDDMTMDSYLEEAGDLDVGISVAEGTDGKTEEAEACDLVAQLSVTSPEIGTKEEQEVRDLNVEISVTSQEATAKETEEQEVRDSNAEISEQIRKRRQASEVEPPEMSKNCPEQSQTDKVCSGESKVDKSANVTKLDEKSSEVPMKEVSKAKEKAKKRAAHSPANKASSASSSLSSGSPASSAPDKGSSGARSGRKRSLDSSPVASSKRACPQSEGMVRVSLRTLGPWLQPADMAVLLVPFFFPHEPNLLFMDASFASGPGWEGPGRPRQLVVPLTRRKDFLEFYDGRPPRARALLSHHVTEVASLESWRLELEGLDGVPEGFLPRRLSQLPPEPKQHFEGALRWASTFARTAHGLLRHLHRCARVPRPRRPSEDFVVELRVENGPEDQVVLHAMRCLIQGLAPYSGLIFRSRGDAPGWTNLHVVITGNLLDALVLIAATNRRSLVYVHNTESYVLVSGGLSHLQSWMAPPYYLRSRFSRTLNRLGPRKSRLALLQNLLRHLLVSRPAPILPACCMDLVVRLGVCADDANLVARILLTSCRSVRDYGPELASGCLSDFKLEGAGFMCCVEDAGLIEFMSQLIYCPCSTCTPFLYERGQIEPPSLTDLL